MSLQARLVMTVGRARRNGDRTVADCGDGKLNSAAGETCDDAVRGELDADCSAVVCGGWST